MIEDFDISNLKSRKATTDTPITPNIEDKEAIKTAFDNTRKGLKIISVPLDIDTVNGVTKANLAGETTAPVVSPVNGKTSLTLKFNRRVWPENGKIIVRPAGTNAAMNNWLIPPVLTNDEYIKIESALSDADVRTLTDKSADYYIRTTHGLLKNDQGQYTGTPDTSTKYVLNFTSNIDNTALRPVLDRAKFLYEETDVTITGVTDDTVTVEMNRLPDGRLWKLEIVGPNEAINGGSANTTNTPNGVWTDPSGAFRDEAGNTFAGWNTNSTYLFWSATTAEPVIRVERVSNNRSYTSTTGLAVNMYGNTGAMPDLSANPDAIFRTNVRYRIDCVTPGASITFNTWNRGDFGNNPDASANVNRNRSMTVRRGVREGGTGGGAAIITNNMTERGTYGPSAEPPDSNAANASHGSIIADATADELAGITGLVVYSAIGEIGDGSMYTARKDYVAAQATRTRLAASGRGYEGAFKTLIVFRNFQNLAQGGTSLVRGALVNNNNLNTTNNVFLRLEAANIKAGPVTIAGFPLSYNDMTKNENGGCKGARNFFRNPNSIDGLAANVDWIWISWEIVSPFWHVPMVDIDPRPFAQLRNGSDANPWNWGSWDSTEEDWYVYSYRGYGQWGLRVNHWRN
jgi:hypothetical protein